MGSEKPKIIDLFAGAGGLSLGFRMAGFEAVFAIDSDEASCRTYAKNFGNHIYNIDIRKVNHRFIKAEVGPLAEKVEVIVGGPPCQGFSVQRRGEDSDERNNLVLEFIRLVEEIKPQFFVMENVGGLLSKRGKSVMQLLMERVHKAGYVPHIKKLNASEFGVPQMRKRVFIIGEKSSTGLTNFKFPVSLDNSDLNVSDFIKDLMDKGPDDVPNHISDRLSEINLQRIRALKPGQSRDSLPPHLQLDCHKRNGSHRHMDVYGRMPWSGLAPTITARFDSFSRGRFGHPELDRSITLREGARLQTFPDNFVFEGTKGEVARQIGNAVPPLLAKGVAQSIMEALKNHGTLA